MERLEDELDTIEHNWKALDRRVRYVSCVWSVRSSY
jgi:hypothetical protein